MSTSTIEPGRITWLSGALGSGTSTLLLALAGLAPRLTGGERAGTVHRRRSRSGELDRRCSAGIAYLGPSPALQISGIASTVRDEIAVGPMNLGEPRERDRRRHRSTRCSRLASRPSCRRARPARSPAAKRSASCWRPCSRTRRARGCSTNRSRRSITPAPTQVQHLLRELARDGATVVVACDDADTMLDVADRLIVMQRGRVVLDGEPATLLAGDAIIAAGAGTTDAATLAREAGSGGAASAAPRRVAAAGRAASSAWQRSPRARRRSIGRAAARRSDPGLSRVAFAYPGGPPVLERVTFAIRPGEAVGLFGANGAGKSTLLRLAMALEHPGAGTVTTLGDRHRGGILKTLPREPASCSSSPSASSSRRRSAPNALSPPAWPGGPRPDAAKP